MQKTLIILTVVVIVGGIGVYLLLLFGLPSTSPQSTPPPNYGGFLPDMTGGVTPNTQPRITDGMLITTVTGNQIAVKDFKKDPATVADTNNVGHYYLSGGVDIGNSNNSYSILYIESDQSFNVTLLEEPLGDTRTKAEAELIQKLGISKNDMCFLRYVVGTPYWVNEIYAGKNLGFSFCPGATQL
ncbi:hypothetical protein A2943_02940 [Candidatus Adlerbacteria bacterium RIFCSPLOWO2_01_FULL_51_16]|uniref:Uncharacterized protein n=1 Tax=Candidatus Adlerbacteria bacterium RIFCSPLOWO2_01_FULL_51_16 TaxID=1797243 RepID=A0A1F4XGH0_9BACT|nr:MAG: hypothetical protein A2943_02940 [Candidatus Adlerbacteria bacterium RIFCSPLOWO2_01_FULL_51_16]